MATETKVLDINGTKSLVKRIQDNSTQIQQNKDISLNIQRCDIASVEVTQGNFSISTRQNRLIFSDTEFETTEQTNTCRITLSDYNNRNVRIVGSLTFEAPYQCVDDFSFRIFSGEYSVPVYQKYFGDSCTIEVNILLKAIDYIDIWVSNFSNNKTGIPMTSGTLYIVPYDKSNTSVYVQENTPINRDINDLWVWDGSVRRYDGSNWVDVIADGENSLISNATYTYDLNDYTESGTYVFEDGTDRMNLQNSPVESAWLASLQVWNNHLVTHQMLLVSRYSPPNDITVYVRSLYSGSSVGSGWIQLAQNTTVENLSKEIGDIETALDSIIAMQDSLIGGDSV